MDYPAAQRLAAQLQGRLLILSSTKEEAFILEQGRGLVLWMSGARTTGTAEWRDERNRLLGYIGKWGPGQPPLHYDEQLLAIHTATTPDRGWHDHGQGDLAHACIEWGEEYPEKPVEVIVETPAASGTELDSVATGKWIRLVDANTVLTSPKQMKFENGILELDDATLEFLLINARNVILRAKVLKISGDYATLGLRCDAGNVVAFLAGHDQSGGDSFGIGQSANPLKVLATAHTGKKVQPDKFVQMAFAAIGDTLTLYVDGHKAAPSSSTMA
jgi:hypothetical protein